MLRFLNRSCPWNPHDMTHKSGFKSCCQSFNRYQKRDRVRREREREGGAGGEQERLTQVGGKLKRTGNGFTAFRWRIRDLTWQQQPQREGICCRRRRRRRQQQQCCYLGYAWVFLPDLRNERDGSYQLLGQSAPEGDGECAAAWEKREWRAAAAQSRAKEAVLLLTRPKRLFRCCYCREHDRWER